MKCAVHPEIDAVGFCRNCGKPLCQSCARPVQGALYCEQCLASMMSPQGPAAQFAAPSAAPAYGYPPVVEYHGPNPGTACCLGFIPGLGAVYNGEYVKGLIHVIIFGGLIAIMSTNPPDGLLAIVIVSFVAFCCYMPVEAYRTARAKRLGHPVTGFFGETAAVPPSTPGAEPGPQGGTVVHRNYAGSIILIVLGVVFLLATTDVLSSRWVWDLWPLVLIAVGVYMIFKRRS